MFTWKRGAAAAVVVYAGSLVWRSVNPQPRPPRLRFTDVPPIPSSTSERLIVFERIAEKYDLYVARAEAGDILTHRKQLMALAKGKVLEVGVGTGRNFAFYPTSTVTSITAIDNSPKMLEQARAKYSQLTNPQYPPPPPSPTTQASIEKNKANTIIADTVDSSAVSPIVASAAAVAARADPSRPLPAPLNLPPVTFSLLDAYSLPYETGSFDTVVDTLGLCSYSSPQSVLHELARVSRQPDGSGRVLLMEHGRISRDSDMGQLGIVSAIMQWMQSAMYSRKHCQAWGCDLDRDIEQLVESAGMKVVNKKHLGQGRVTTYVLSVPSQDETTREAKFRIEEEKKKREAEAKLANAAVESGAAVAS